MFKNRPAPNRLNLKGKRFGRLLVICDAGTRGAGKRSHSCWECQCDCGQTKIIAGSNLTSGDTTSCGCFNKERVRETKSISKKDYRLNRVMATYQRVAKLKGLAFKLTRELFHELITSECYYCGVAPSNCHKPHGKNIVYQGIDRKDNSKGYTPENCVPCCIVCNKMKKAMGHDEFLYHVVTIADRFEVKSPQPDFHYEVSSAEDVL